MTEFLTSLGRAVNSALLYGQAHRMTSVAVSDAFRALQAALGSRPRLALSLVEGELRVDGVAPQSGEAPLVRLLRSKLDSAGLSGFSFTTGMTRHEFGEFIALLSDARTGAGDAGVAAELRRRHLAHVEIDDAEYQRVARDETVVSKDQARPRRNDSVEQEVDAFLRQIASGSGGTDSDSAAGPAVGEGQAERGRAGSDEQAPVSIVAFLKGETGHAGGAVPEEVRDVASDPERLAGFIMEATLVRQRAGHGGETLGDLVIGCLRRTYDGLERAADSSGRDLRPDQGLALLEKAVLDKLHALMEGVDDFPVPELESGTDPDAVREMTAEYVRRRQALERMEGRLQTAIGSVGDPVLQRDLGDQARGQGVMLPGWNQISGPGSPGVTGGEGAGEVGGSIAVLTALLSQLDELMSGDTDGRPLQTVRRVGQAVGRAAEATAGKIEALVGSGAGGVQDRPGLDEADQAELLAEIVQEICQPATAISCSVALLAQIGPLEEDQREIVSVVRSCSERLTYLLERLRGIVGVPKDHIPKQV